ncbi:MAG: radical SAM protein [Methylovirgula sp.]|uniref:radical SAM protein n=1 Tax=Methylovirgula sp. TaxID=1978224 RepID=UPI0030764363
MLRVGTVIVKLASRCNLGCSYCYIYEMADSGWMHQPKIMSAETVRLLSRQLSAVAEKQQEPFEVIFHGGEPLLVGPVRFESICHELRGALPSQVSLGLQTNGVLLSEQIIGTCVRYGISVSVSIDGPAAVHDRHRPNRRGYPSHSSVLTGIKRLQSFPGSQGLLTGLLAVVDRDSDPIEVYEFLKSLKPNGIDLLLRDGNHDVLPPGKSSIHSTEYGSWMARLLDHYLRDTAPVPVRVLDEMLKLLMAPPGRFNGRKEPEDAVLVIETDGSLSKNDTLKCAYEGADRFAKARSVHNDCLVDVLCSAEFEEYCLAQPPSSQTCLACPDFGPCGGGTPAHRWASENGFDNPSVFCADQRYLVAAMRRHLAVFGSTA